MKEVKNFRLLITILLLMTVFSTKSADFKEPDFAYPKTVTADAEKMLASADKITDPKQAGITRLRALLELTAADAAIDPDSIFAWPTKIDRVADAETDATVRGLMKLYEAVLLNKIYYHNSYSYDRIKAPLSPLPADVSEWSGEQFKKRINELIEQSSALTSDATSPVADYAAVIECDSLTAVYLPTIADVAAEIACSQNYIQSIAGKACRESIFNSRIAAAQPISDTFFYWLTESCRYKENSHAALIEEYERYINVEGARLLLYYAIDDENDNLFIAEEYPSEETSDNPSAKLIASRHAAIERLHRTFTDFPHWWGNAEFENKLKSLTQPKIRITMPAKLAPGATVNADIEYSFAQTVGFRIYSLPEGEKTLTIKKITSSCPLIAEVKLNAKADGIAEKLSAPVALTKVGRYAVVATINGKLQNDRYASEINVVPFMPMVFTGLKKAAVATVDYVSGRPLRGVDVSIESFNPRKYKKKRLGRTDSDGILNLDIQNIAKEYNRYSFAYDGHNYGKVFDMSIARIHSDNKSDTTRYASIFTERPLYHPGDSLGVAVIVSRSNGIHWGAEAIVPDCDITVTLFDANNQKADSCTLRTDATGRAACTFSIPKDRLTGNYRININDSAKRSIGNRYVTVSDFRLPTFEVKVTSVERDTPASGAVRLSGRAVTYSGMPVASASVVAHIFGATRWRWFYPARELGDVEAKTDAMGNFVVDLDSALLAKKIDNIRVFNDFIADIDVTALTAETASTSRNFTTGKPYTLDMTDIAGIIDCSKPVNFTPMAYDADGNNAAIALKWTLYDSNDKNVTYGKATAGKTVDVDWNALDAGMYRIELCAADSTLADVNKNAAYVTLYNIVRGTMPGSTTLFLPTDTYTAADTLNVCFGVSIEKAWVYTALCIGDEITKISVGEYAKGFHNIGINLPADSNDEAKLVLVSYRDGKPCEQTVMIHRPDTRKINIEAESFRDRLVPGSGETWRFRISDVNGKPLTDAAMIATLYNRALNSLGTLSWPNGFNTYVKDTKMRVRTAQRSGIFCFYDLPYERKYAPAPGSPQFRFNKYNIYYNLHSRIYGARVTELLLVEDDNLEAEREVLRLDEVVTVSGYAASKRAAAAGITNTEKEESADEEVYAEEDTAADTGDIEAPQPGESFAYRDSETLQAFWMPRLVANADGVVEMIFNVPNANGSWMLNAFAWTPDLRTASHKATCVSAKPVMVQPNLPRFMRQGDTAVVPATVFNNSDVEATVSTTVEIFDSATGTITDTAVSTDTIAPGASAIVDIRVQAPANVAAIGYRVRSVSGNFADGEQNIIPILASAATVIESNEFYLNPKDNKDFELTIPAAGNNNVTLQYCQNPIWNIVRAMRGVQSLNTEMANHAASALFSVLASQRIIADNPAIEKVIGEWKNNPQSEALTSMLSRNQQLKSLLLEQTPWLQTAQEQSRRMEMLSQMFDSKAVDAAITENIASLKKVQTDDGGFRWGPWCRESSLWTTENVLITMAIANSLNMLPTDNAELTGMLKKAVTYVDRTISDPKFKVDTDITLAFIHAMMPQFKASTAAKAIIDRTVAGIESSWKKDDTIGKAYDILILRAAGRDALAEELLTSLREFGVIREGMGLCFPSVDDIRGYATIIQAFAAMDAPADELNAMRQWICVRSQATDDLGAYNPDYVIAATMLTGSCWTDVPVANYVTVNDSPISLDDTDSASGYFAQAIDTNGRKTTVSVRPNGVTPSYGSVVTIASRQATTVKARPGKDVAVEKRFLVKGDDGKWRECESFSLGQRLTVQLTIKVKRDLEYVAITDERAAALEPVEQLPGNIIENGLIFYRENRDAATNIFIDYLPRGTYHLSYEMTANNAGVFTSGIATLQSQYAPEITAHSAGTVINVAER